MGRTAASDAPSRSTAFTCSSLAWVALAGEAVHWPVRWTAAPVVRLRKVVSHLGCNWRLSEYGPLGLRRRQESLEGFETGAIPDGGKGTCFLFPYRADEAINLSLAVIGRRGEQFGYGERRCGGRGARGMEALLYPAVRAESQAPLDPPLGHGHDGGRHAEARVGTSQGRCAVLLLPGRDSSKKSGGG